MYLRELGLSIKTKKMLLRDFSQKIAKFTAEIDQHQEWFMGISNFLLSVIILLLKKT